VIVIFELPERAIRAAFELSRCFLFELHNELEHVAGFRPAAHKHVHVVAMTQRAWTKNSHALACL
jgi:hypothetical protein